MLKVFEAFSGYGSQRIALKNIGFPHEVVGISEIDADALIAYAAIHTNFSDIKGDFEFPDKETMIKELLKFNVPLDYRTFINRAPKLTKSKLEDVYLANNLSKNYGDIRIINPKDLPDFDLFTYSFPCQDISVAGFQGGFDKGSGTRSSLLWESCKIIENKRPSYLLMENVKNLVGRNHIDGFREFLKYLESLGYKNYWDVLNARDYGIPQNRERVFCISILNSEIPFVFPQKKRSNVKVEDLLEKKVAEKYFLKGNQKTSKPIKQDFIYCLDSNYWKGTSLEGFLTKKRRQVVSGDKEIDGMYPARRLTPLETWRFMGCDDDIYNKVNQFISETGQYRLTGNSIVVQVLEEVFKQLKKYHKGGKSDNG